MNKLRAWWAYQQGAMLRFLGHRTISRELYQASVTAFTRAIDVWPDYADAFLARGLLYWRELQAHHAAIADFTRVLDLVPQRTEALFYRGMAYQQAGDYAASAIDLREAIRLSPQAGWRNSAVSQLQAIEAILDEIPKGLDVREERLLPPGFTEDAPASQEPPL